MSELIGIAHLSKSERLGIPPLLVSFFIHNINGHKSQDARQWIMDKKQTVTNRKTQETFNMLIKYITQDFFNIFRLQLTLGK